MCYVRYVTFRFVTVGDPPYRVQKRGTDATGSAAQAASVAANVGGIMQKESSTIFCPFNCLCLLFEFAVFPVSMFLVSQLLMFAVINNLAVFAVSINALPHLRSIFSFNT